MDTEPYNLTSTTVKEERPSFESKNSSVGSNPSDFYDPTSACKAQKDGKRKRRPEKQVHTRVQAVEIKKKETAKKRHQSRSKTPRFQALMSSLMAVFAMHAEKRVERQKFLRLCSISGEDGWKSF